MGYKFTRYNRDLQYFALYSQGFNCQETGMIIDLERLQTFEKGKVGHSNMDPAKDVRDSDVAWIHHDQHSDWLYRKLSDISGIVNYDHFLYDIDGIEALQYTRYGPNQHYTWHWDFQFGWGEFERKISFVVCLSDPNDYEGGEFEICHNGNFESSAVLKPNKGDIIYFASWMPHRVRPVISGERKSLVGWIMGKRQ